MLTVKLLPAGYGDCILLSLGEHDKYNILIDGGVAGCKETLRMSKKEKSEKNRKKLRNPENMGFSTFLFLKIDILGVAKK